MSDELEVWRRKLTGEEYENIWNDSGHGSPGKTKNQ